MTEEYSRLNLLSSTLNRKRFSVLCMTTMGQRIQQMRKAKQLTQEALGKACGVSKGAISQWENGTITDMKAEAALDCALALDTTVAWLVREEGPRTPFQARSDAEIQLLEIFRALPPSAQESAVGMLKLAKATHFDGDEQRRNKFQAKVAAPSRRNKPRRKA